MNTNARNPVKLIKTAKVATMAIGAVLALAGAVARRPAPLKFLIIKSMSTASASPTVKRAIHAGPRCCCCTACRVRRACTSA